MAENYPRADRKSMCREDQERGWREALQWLRENEDAHCCGDTDAVGDWTDCPKNIAIEDELGESK